jgi:hypothetical protein
MSQENEPGDLARRMALLPVSARKLLCLVARQAHSGPLRSKKPGTATMPEVHEACGLDVDAMIALIEILREARFLEIEGEYPFETMRVTGALDSCIQKCIGANVSLEKVIVDLQFELLANR